VLKENIHEGNTSLSDKYKGMLTKEQCQQLIEHVKQMQSEWNSI